MTWPPSYVLIDADLLVIDRLPVPDQRDAVNRELLRRIEDETVLAGIPTQALFEVVGKWSYQTPTEEIDLSPLSSSRSTTCSPSRI